MTKTKRKYTREMIGKLYAIKLGEETNEEKEQFEQFVKAWAPTQAKWLRDFRDRFEKEIIEGKKSGIEPLGIWRKDDEDLKLDCEDCSFRFSNPELLPCVGCANRKELV